MLLILFLLVAVLCRPAPCPAAQPLVIGAADSYPLGGALVDILEDPGGTLTIHDVTSPRYADAFTPSSRPIPNFGMTDSAFWLRFTISGGGRGGEEWLLLLDQPLMDRVELYLPMPDGAFNVARSGDMIPLAERTIREREIVLPLDLAASGAPRTLYLRTWIPGRAQMPLTVMTREAFQSRTTAQNFFFGGYSGFMVVLALLGFSLFVILRDRNYLLYACYVLGVLATTLGFTGNVYAFVLPDYPRLNDCLILQFAAAALMTELLFDRRFLHLGDHAPRLHRVMGWFAWICFVSLILCPFTPPLFYKRFLNAFAIIISMTELIAATASLRKGFLPARIHLCGRMFRVFTFLFLFTNEGFLSATTLTRNSLLFESLGVLSFITLALGFNIVLMRRRVVTLVAGLENEVEERAAANRALQEQMEERQRLEREVRRISREERRRISFELHDGLCQQLTGARLRFAALEDRFSAAGMRADAQPLGDLLEESVDHAYALSRRLWNSDETPGVDLHELVLRLSEQSGISIRLDQDNNCPECACKGLPSLHQIAREALHNAVKHSGATRIAVTLNCDGETLRLEVRDNGRGIAAGRGRGGSLGIGMMRYHAARIGGAVEITDVPEGGTGVVCVAPCLRPCPAEAADV